MRFLLLVVTLLVAISALHAQAPRVDSLSTTSYPTVRVHLSGGGANLKSEDFRATENGTAVALRLVGGGNSGGAAVFFLVEASGHTYGQAVNHLKNAVHDALEENNTNGSPVNVGYFGRANAGGQAMQTLSAAFSNDPTPFLPMINDRIQAPRDTFYRSDVFKAIYEAIDYMGQQRDLPARKVLVVLSAAINNSASPIRLEDCVRRAKDKGVEVHTVAYSTGNRTAADNLMLLSEQTNGRFKRVQTEDEAADAVTDVLENSLSGSGGATTIGAALEYTATGTADGEPRRVEVLYKDASIFTGEYTPDAPGGKGFTGTYGLWLVIGVVVLLLAVVGWVLLNKNKKRQAHVAQIHADANADREAIHQRMLNQSEAEKQRLQEELRRQQQAAGNQPQKLDLKRTTIQGGAVQGTAAGPATQLTVVATGFQQTFGLNKPTLTIGRGAENDIQIPDGTVSGTHAKLYQRNGEWYIEDAGSTNGTFVNGQRVQGVVVRTNDQLRLGNATATLA